MEIVSIPKPTSHGNTYDDKYRDIQKQEVGDFAKGKKIPESVLQNT